MAFLIINRLQYYNNIYLRYGLVVRIAGSHPAGPGSIPGAGKLLFSLLYSQIQIRKFPAK